MMSMQQMLNACGLSDWNTYRGLLWHEWQKKKRIHQAFFVIFILMILASSIYTFYVLKLFALSYAVFTVPYSMVNIISDEFYFSLPPSRKQRFLILWSMGFFPVFIMILIWAVLAISIRPEWLGYFIQLASAFTGMAFYKEPLMNQIDLRAISYVLSIMLLMYSLFFYYAFAISLHNKETLIVVIAMLGFGFLDSFLSMRLPIHDMNFSQFILLIFFLLGGCYLLLYTSYKSFSRLEIPNLFVRQRKKGIARRGHNNFTPEN